MPILDHVNWLAHRKESMAFLQGLQLRAIAKKRSCARGSNPNAAEPGKEFAFEEAARTCRLLEYALRELEQRPKRVRLQKNVKGVAVRIIDRYLLVIGLFGLIGTAITGFTLLCMTFQFPPWWLLAAGIGIVLMLELPGLLHHRHFK